MRLQCRRLAIRNWPRNQTVWRLTTLTTTATSSSGSNCIRNSKEAAAQCLAKFGECIIPCISDCGCVSLTLSQLGCRCRSHGLTSYFHFHSSCAQAGHGNTTTKTTSTTAKLQPSDSYFCILFLFLLFCALSTRFQQCANIFMWEFDNCLCYFLVVMPIT